MKNVVLIAALLCGACVNPNQPSEVALGTPFELAVGKTAELPGGVRITFERVAADSRCPMDALCVTAGDATVIVNARRSSGAAVPLELHTMSNGASVNVFEHTIALTALQPYPRASQPIAPNQYVATFVISTR